jgi:hypothetical protein
VKPKSPLRAGLSGSNEPGTRLVMFLAWR